MSKYERFMGDVESLKSFVPSKFTSSAELDKYFQSMLSVTESLVKELMDSEEANDIEVKSLKSSIKELQTLLENKQKSFVPLTKEEIECDIGKIVCGILNKDKATLGELKCYPNLKVENWNKAKDFTWDITKGWVRSKDVLGEPMGDMATNDQFMIAPIYENHIMTEATRKSVMMPLVYHRLMSSPSVMISERDHGGIVLNWLTSYGERIEGSKLNAATRVELKAYTLAGYVSVYDEFEDDAFADIGKLFIDDVTEQYAQEFDRQCLTANKEPFIGALHVEKAEKYAIASTDGSKLTYLDFRNAELKVRAEERSKCAWFFNETVMNEIANIRDDNGNPIWRRPGDSMPGKIDGYPYHVCDILPQFSELKANTPFAVFMNPKRIIHGNRRGIEIKRFDSTSESLEFGEVFMRFRKRDGFLVTRPAKNMVVMTTAKG